MIPFPYSLLVGGAIFIGVGVGAWKIIDTYNTAVEDKVKAEQRAKDTQEALDSALLGQEKLREMGLLADALGKQTKKELQHERTRAGEFERKLQEAGATDPSLKAWMDAPVHPSARSMRRASPDPDPARGAVLDPGGPAPPNSGPRPE
jgi:hypothetical protein